MIIATVSQPCVKEFITYYIYTKYDSKNQYCIEIFQYCIEMNSSNCYYV